MGTNSRVVNAFLMYAFYAHRFKYRIEKQHISIKTWSLWKLKKKKIICFL